MDFDARVKQAIYQHIVDTTRVPRVAEVGVRISATKVEVAAAYRRLNGSHVLVLKPDEVTILMASPFSGIPTQHVVRVGEKEYFANCAWDALGIPAALHASAEVFSRCEQTREPLHLTVDGSGPTPESSACLAHFAVPTAQWRKDIRFT
ncbi:MAG: hypothetical protein NVS4B3_01240 [Gemmatimonadaceae bacterium]